MARENNIILKTGQELVERLYDHNNEDLNEVVRLINSSLSECCDLTSDLFLQRLESDDAFFVGYEGENVVSALESRLIRNDQIIIPSDADYDRLTVNGTWDRDHLYTEGKNEILILVNVVANPDFRGSGAKTIAKIKDYVAKNTDYENILTFTPDIEGVRNWHKRCGAVETNILVENARPSYGGKVRFNEGCDNPKRVRAMDYSLAIENIRMG